MATRKVEMKPTDMERDLYRDYCESINGHNDALKEGRESMEPRSQEEWTQHYRETQLRLRRERDAQSTS